MYFFGCVLFIHCTEKYAKYCIGHVFPGIFPLLNKVFFHRTYSPAVYCTCFGSCFGLADSPPPPLMGCLLLSWHSPAPMRRTQVNANSRDGAISLRCRKLLFEMRYIYENNVVQVKCFPKQKCRAIIPPRFVCPPVRRPRHRTLPEERRRRTVRRC